jgi:hypothetical protein
LSESDWVLSAKVLSALIAKIWTFRASNFA